MTETMCRLIVHLVVLCIRLLYMHMIVEEFASESVTMIVIFGSCVNVERD